ncbi:MAG: hypothetical protein ACC700_15825 [Anaerolineales bacterium]
MNRRIWIILLALVLVVLLLYLLIWTEQAVGHRNVVIVDGGGRPVESLEAGSTLFVGARALEPHTSYELVLTIPGLEGPAGEPVSYSRIGTDSEGNIPPIALWYHSGVIGCSQRLDPDAKLGTFAFRSFDEAEKALAGRRLSLSVYRSEGREPRISAAAMAERKEAQPVAVLNLSVVQRRSPMVYPSRADGCLINSREVEGEDLYVTGRNFAPGAELEISVVPNQRAWWVGDSINDVTGAGSVAAPERAIADADGRFTVRLWESALQRRGTYDIVAHRLGEEVQNLRRVGPRDIISYGADTGFILYLRYPIGGPTMDLAGRQVSGSPYFQFADSFAETGDTVWAAVDPTYVPAGHTGGSYAAYYVVQHRDVNGWDPSAGGATNLVDVSGAPGADVTRVKSGCINGTDFPIWQPPLIPGEYDVVVDFGNTPAETSTTYVTDSNFDTPVDFLDGADQIGFIVAKDPHERGMPPAAGTYAIGERSYSNDDFLTTLGSASDVDLRAVVRYPAVTAGANTAVAAGTHPLFVIEHGNHLTCEVLRDGRDPYDVLGTIPWVDFLALLYEYDDCPQRKPNHEGYMELLNVLASHGIIAVSIDAYDLTSCTTSGCRPQWIPERGELILKHLELWAHLNDSTQFPSYPDYFSAEFNGHVDMNKISVSGHSRGGEASVAAYMINAASAMPFSIGSVSSIAPVDGQSYVLPDVPYFVILPAADDDVWNLSGARIYDRAGSATTPVADSTVKSSIHVYGANHNFFNTVWAADGDDSWTPRDNFIAATDQQELGAAYLAAFTRVHLLGQTVYQDMLRGQLVFPSTAGYKIYPTHHEKQHSKVESGTAAGTPSGGATEAVISGPSVHSTQAVTLGWSSSGAEYTYALSGFDASPYEVLSFRAAQTNSGTNPASGSQEFRIELRSGTKMKAVFINRFDPIPQPYNRLGGDHNVMNTVRIPLHSFIMNKTEVDLTNLDSIRFLFSNPSQGEIYVDDIEFSR